MLTTSLMTTAPPTPAARPIPGSHGLPIIGPLKDRLDYFWFQGPDSFFRRRAAAHNSTVFRTNIPPTFPFFISTDPSAIAVADAAAFAALFDPDLVDKRDVLVGSYKPSSRFTGGTRVVVYMDPSEPKHAAIKAFCLDVLRRGSRVWVVEFLRELDAMLAGVEKELGEKGRAAFLVPLQKCVFNFLAKSIAGADPSSSPEIAQNGYVMLDKWLALQLLPTTKAGVLPQPLEELLLHSFAFPFFLVSGDYKKLYDFIAERGGDVIELGVKTYGLKREEAINNILFVLGFNAYGGFSVFLPSLLTAIGRNKSDGGAAPNGLQDRLRAEVRRVLAGGRSVDLSSVKEMSLVRSTIYEILRLKPPVPLQFGRARRSFELRSHDASFSVTKGELLCGYQPLAMRDPAVFSDPEEFVPDRFVGGELLRYLYWSNGPESDEPTTANKQCAAKDYVVATACMLVAELFRRYDFFECDESLNFTKLERAAAEAAATDGGRVD